MNSLVILCIVGALALVMLGVVLRVRARRRQHRFSIAVSQPRRTAQLGPILATDPQYPSVDYAFPGVSSSLRPNGPTDGINPRPGNGFDSDVYRASPTFPAFEVPSDDGVSLVKETGGKWRSGLRKPNRHKQIRYHEDGSLRRGRELGSGGQGAVYELVEHDDEVEKRFLVPLQEGSPDFEELLRRRSAVEAAISACPIHLCWPESPVRREETLVGYTMPRIPDRFYFEMKLGNASVKRRERELQHAIPRASALSLPFEVDDGERFELVYLVARFLDAMHRNDIVYGDISWANFTFALHPTELCVLDFDSSRIQGSMPFTRIRPVDTLDWEDPEWQSSVVARMDSDRYKFALLAYRMLVAKSLDADLAVASDVPMLDELTCDRLAKLWMRARGQAGTRPQITEWLAVLETVRDRGVN